jgi:hypothetical protein
MTPGAAGGMETTASQFGSTSYGCGGGGGGGSAIESSSSAGAGALYGGGGGGGGNYLSSWYGSAGSGRAGIIVITYTPSTARLTLNMPILGI